MSTTETYFEELHIRENSPKGEKLVRALADYILQYNGMKGLENLMIIYLELVCGDERAVVEERTEVETGNSWLISQNGMEWHNEDHAVWNDDHPLMNLLKNLKPDRDIIFRMSACRTGTYIPDYSYCYWLSALEGIAPEDGVDYRCAEAADTDERVWAYHLNGNGTEQVPRDGTMDLVSDIPAWCSETFAVKVSCEDEDKFVEFEEKIGEAMQILADILENEFLEPDVFEGEAELSGTLELQAEQIPDFLKSLQAISDAAGELGADFECACELLPAERTNNGIEPFAVLKIEGKDGKVEASACRF